MKRLLLLALLAVSTLSFGQARPQLAEADAARYRVTDYLAQGPQPWQPAALADTSGWRADFVVAADGSGTHRSVQAAIDAVPSRDKSQTRHYIHVKPGVYREQVCVQGKAPLTLYGSAADASATVIVEGHYNAETKRAGVDAAHPCEPALAAASYGTAGSASVVLFSDDVQLAHLTVANDAMERVRGGVGYPSGAGESGGAQAVALMTRGDRMQLENVRLLGHQDTLYARAAAPGAAARVYVHASVIAGDVDFIFGDATLVIDRSTVISRAGRRVPGHGGHVLAPSTPPGTRLGFLVNASRMLAEPGVAPASISLGRGWDFGVARGAWQPGVSPNGQALIRDSVLGPHLTLWAASTSGRPFSAAGEAANRFAEFGNWQGDADAGRDVLPVNDGWAAAAGGTTGGAAARPGDVFDVRNRAELVAALAPPQRPRIIRVRGRIDLSVDDAGKPLGFDDYRDAAFDPAAFEREFDPARWGKKPPEGPLEQARRRSAKAQSERVMVRLPADTTVIGVGADARIVNGMLFVDRVDNVIVRNIHFSDAYDHFPAWDPNDNASGEWNSEYDNVSLRGATHVWVDHCSFDDGDRPDAAERVALGRRVQHHDGLLDITQQSNHVTVSWNHFHHHDKTTLVGSSDGQVLDAGKLKITFHHNLWEQVKERTPRVRYGEVHVYNNLFVGGGDADYAFGYSIGVGMRSRVFSERNAWEVPAPAGKLTRVLKGTAFFDRESLLNGQPVDLLAALREANPGVAISGDVGWQPLLALPLDAAADVAAEVRAGAGALRP